MSSVVGQIGGGSASPDSFVLSCGRNNSNVNNLWLRDAQGTPLNLSPWIIPYTARIVGISASSRTVGNLDFEVYRQPDVRLGGNPASGNRIAFLNFAGVNEGSDDTLSVNLSAGDGIGVFARGSGISFPRVMIWIVRTS